jgi:hypothetical protein
VTHDEAVKTLATERYLLGEMPDGERDAFEEHFFDCPDCADDVRAGGLVQDGVRAGLLGTSRAAAADPRVLPFRTRRGLVTTILPWAAAATFAVIAGYQALGVPRVSSRVSDGAVALAPVTLRPPTRGAVPDVQPGPGGVITLAVDLDSLSASSELTWTLTDERGAALGSGRVERSIDMQGMPLLLMIRPEMVQGAGLYTLTVKDPRNPTLTDGSYRFTVGAR